MPKKRPHKKSSNLASMGPFKLLIMTALIVLIGGFVIKIASPFIGLSTSVLGISTYLAQGKSGGSHGRPDNPGSQKDDHVPQALPIQATTKAGSHINITDETVETQIEHTNHGLEIKAERQNGVTEDLNDDTIDQINGRLGDSNIRVATDDGSIVVAKKHLGAKTHFPLSIDLATNTLIVTTPAGRKEVTVLPDVAVNNILTKGILSKIGGGIASDSAGMGDASGSAGMDSNATGGAITTNVETDLSGGDTEEITTEGVDLELEDGELVYKVKGSLKKHLFWLIPVNINKTVTVSAESGEITSTDLPLLDNILNTVSF